MTKKVILNFEVESLRKIPNPYIKSDEGEKDALMYIAICDVTKLPKDIPMGTNPRNQNLKTNVAKTIEDSLLNDASLDFYLLNRGLLLSAKDVSFNNYSNELTVIFDDLDVHGNVDGGHTYKIIQKHQAYLEPRRQYVKIEILTGVEDIFQNLASARNKSAEVQDKSIAELEKRFDIIKHVIENESFFKDVFFRENDIGRIDVADIVAILNAFNIDRFSGISSFPIISYSGKKKCIDYYISDHKKYGESKDNPYVKMAPIMVDIFKLYDAIESNIDKFYRDATKGKYGAIKGVNNPKKGQKFKTRFYQEQMGYGTPTGFIYPILGSFRALIEEKDGVYAWKHDPFKVLEKVGGNLVSTTIERSRTLGNNPQSTGKDTGNWQLLYMTVSMCNN